MMHFQAEIIMLTEIRKSQKAIAYEMSRIVKSVDIESRLVADKGMGSNC